MNVHPIATPASLSFASPLFDAKCDSIESLTTTFTAPVVPALLTMTITEVELGYHSNQQYSITAMATSTGAERYAYTACGHPTILNASGSPIGNQQSQIANRFTYTGSEWDETLGLHHFRARWMSPLANRFLARDPIGYDGSEWELYEYVRAKPLDVVDTMGLWQRPGPQIPGSVSLTFACKSKRCIFYSDPFKPGVAGIDTLPLNGGVLVLFADQNDVFQKITSNGWCEVTFAGHQGGGSNTGG
ncbi:MAG: hypothetical protein MUC83_02230 [Pirellula sp.]|jgi:RHS repeat-associated protein|nr:hypothetical protein [Pirellula sp.]